MLPAGASEPVTVTLDASIPPESKDFTRTGTITFETLPNVGTVVVPVSMTVQGLFFGSLEGNITHGGVGVPNAIVIATKTGHVPYTATTDGSGHYSIAEILGGTYDVTVTAAGYLPASATGIAITPGIVTTLNVTLFAPEMSVTPSSLTLTVPAGQQADRTLSVHNSGDGLLVWAGSAHANNKQAAIHIPASNGDFARGTAAVSIGRAPVSNKAANSEFDVLRGTLGYAYDIYPGYTFFSFNTDTPETQNVISPITISPFGGTFDASNTDFMYIIDYNDSHLKKVEIATGNVIDIGLCSSISAAQMWTGIAVDKTSDVMYGITTDISESYIYTIDPATAVATVIGATGIPGAIDVAIDGTGQMYSFDLVGDNSYSINKETGASTLLGSIGYDANYAQGMGWDPEADIVYLAAYNNATGSGELRILDRVTGNTTLVGGMGGEIDGLAFPGGGSAWLTMDPKMGSVLAGGSQDVNIHFNATDLVEGTYTGFITFLSEPNVGTVNVPVTLNVGNIGGPTLTIPDVTCTPGPVSVPVHAAEIVNMGSFQFTLEFDASKMTYTGTSNWYPGITDILVGNPSAGKLTFVWAASAAGITIPDGTFFNVDFTWIGSSSTSPLSWSDNPTPREFADYDGNIFHPNYVNGSVTSGSTISHQFMLNTGYQFVSTYIIPPAPDMTVVLSNILNNNLSFVRNSAGQQLRKIGPTWVNGIGNWVTTEGYLFKMNAAADFTITGAAIASQTPINVNTGYQFVSYLPANPINALTAYETLLDNLSFVRNSAGQQLRKIGNNWVNGIGNANPFEGYLVKMNAADVLVYPANEKSMVYKSRATANHFSFEGGNAADPVYTLYVYEANLNGYSLQAGDEIGVYDGMTLVGSLALTQSPSVENQFDNAIPVFSTLNSGQGFTANRNISFKVWSATRGIELDGVAFNFSNPYGDAYTQTVYPDNDGAYSLVSLKEAQTGTGSLAVSNQISVYPNPLKKGTTIEFNLISDSKVKMLVYNALGVQVATVTNEDWTKGQHNLWFDASTLPQGTYTLQMQVTNNSETVTQMKQLVVIR